MTIFKGWASRLMVAAAACLASSSALDAQTLGNQSLKSNYFFRYVSMAASSAGSISDARSIQGSITFDGAGNYTFAGQQVTGAASAVATSGAGTYSVDPAGVVSLTSPLRSGDFVNARLGSEALIGSGTENSDSAFDLFVAIPAAASSGAFSGPYSAVTLEFPGGSTNNAINTIFNLRISLPGAFFPVSVYGHTPSLASGSPTTQVISNATYVFAGSGSGTLTFGNSSSLLSGSKTVYVSADGNVIIGGSTAPGAHDFLIGVTTLPNPNASSWTGNSWTAGLRFESAAQQPAWVSHSGSLSAQGAGSISFYRRLDELGAGTTDFTASGVSTFNSSGLLTFDLAQVALGVNGMFVASGIDPSDPGAFEIYFGVSWMPLSGSGVFLNPLGVVNAASFAPAGNPISPGEFITLYGSGLAGSTQVAKPPYPATLNNVTVTINGTKAPIYYVSATQINCLVPYSVTGNAAAIVVTNGSATSNSVTVPLAASAPGIYSIASGSAQVLAIEHSNGSLVTSDSPANPGETVVVFVTGLGAVTPSIPDGTASTGSPFNKTALPIVYIANQQAGVLFSGLAPNFPGLYQLNVTIPNTISSAGNYPIGIQTNNAFHDRLFIPIQ